MGKKYYRVINKNNKKGNPAAKLISGSDVTEGKITTKFSLVRSVTFPPHLIVLFQKA